MTLDDALFQLNEMKERGVPGDTKLCGGFSVGFMHFDFDVDYFDDTDYDIDDQGIAVCLKNITQIH